MQFSTIFSRAWEQKYLTPAERALYKLIVSLVIFLPTSVFIGLIDAFIPWLHANVSPLVWLILSGVIASGLASFRKFATAKGDTAVGDVLLQIEARSASDSAAATAASAKTAPQPLVLPSPQTPVPPRTGAGPPDASPPIPFH